MHGGCGANQAEVCSFNTDIHRGLLPLLARVECRWRRHTGGPVSLSPSLQELRLGPARILPDEADDQAATAGTAKACSTRWQSRWSGQCEIVVCASAAAGAAFTPRLDWRTASGLTHLDLCGEAGSLLPSEVGALHRWVQSLLCRADERSR